jgi:hypothetical protein
VSFLNYKFCLLLRTDDEVLQSNNDLGECEGEEVSS